MSNMIPSQHGTLCSHVLQQLLLGVLCKPSMRPRLQLVEALLLFWVSGLLSGLPRTYSPAVTALNVYKHCQIYIKLGHCSSGGVSGIKGLCFILKVL